MPNHTLQNHSKFEEYNMKIRGGLGDSALSNACLQNKKNGIRDLSILQKPIQTSITGFKEVVKAYKDGTEEVS